jgi:WD40 repeat protein
LILTTSSQKLLVWDLLSTSPTGSLHRVIDAHFRAITDINWHARDPNILASTGIDGGVRAFDLRVAGPDAAVIRLSAWGVAGTQVKWNRQHDHILASSHGNEVHIWDTRVSLSCTVNDRLDVLRNVSFWTSRKDRYPSQSSRHTHRGYTASTGIAEPDISWLHARLVSSFDLSHSLIISHDFD